MNSKAVLIFLMIFLSLCGKAQSDTILFGRGKGLVSTITGHGLTLGTGNGWYISEKVDTVKCIMIYCDTEPLLLDTINRNHVDNIHLMWRFGYSVTRLNSWMVTYLDENKKLLPKNIVVWMSQKYPQ